MSWPLGLGYRYSRKVFGWSGQPLTLKIYGYLPREVLYVIGVRVKSGRVIFSTQSNSFSLQVGILRVKAIDVRHTRFFYGGPVRKN